MKQIINLQEEDELYDLQLKEWQPILNWFCKKFDISIESSKDISGPKISMEAKDVLRKYLLSYNSWAVHGMLNKQNF